MKEELVVDLASSPKENRTSENFSVFIMGTSQITTSHPSPSVNESPFSSLQSFSFLSAFVFFSVCWSVPFDKKISMIQFPSLQFLTFKYQAICLHCFYLGHRPKRPKRLHCNKIVEMNEDVSNRIRYS